MHMGRTQEQRAVRVLEEGSIELLYRPRVEKQNPESIDDMQRVLMVLTPENGSSLRVIAIGRKPMQDRFWGFVDLVLHDRRDLEATLGAHVYSTRTRGVGHLPAARTFARGEYHLESHDGDTYLRYVLHETQREEASEANFIVSVANPDPSAWDLEELPDLQLDLFHLTEVHVSIPTTFPPALQQRFNGNRYAPLDTPAWLDHPGAELIFIRG